MPFKVNSLFDIFHLLWRLYPTLPAGGLDELAPQAVEVASGQFPLHVIVVVTLAESLVHV